MAGGAPLVIKLLEGTQGLGVVLADTDRSAKSVIEAFRSANVNILVQEFIKEAGGTDIRALVVGGKVVAAMQRTGGEGEFRSNLHRGGVAKQIKLSPEERSTAIRSAKAMGLNVCGVDMLRANHGPVVMEVNSSPGLEGVEKCNRHRYCRKNHRIAGKEIRAWQHQNQGHRLMASRTPFALGNVQILPGARQTIDLPVSVLSDHTPVTMSVHCVHGPRPGPTLFVSAAVHGDEVMGVEIARRLLRAPQLDCAPRHVVGNTDRQFFRIYQSLALSARPARSQQIFSGKRDRVLGKSSGTSVHA